MSRKGRDLEQLVAILEKQLGPAGIQVKSPDYIEGKQSGSLREVDISLRNKLGSSEVLIIIECRDREGAEDVTWIEQLASKRTDVAADVAMAVSSSAFTSGAQNLAAAHNIELRTLQEIESGQIALWFGFTEVKTYRRVIDFIHIGLMFSQPDTITLADFPPEVAGKMQPKFEVHAPIFSTKKDGNAASLMDIWASAPTDEVFSSISQDGSRNRRQIEINFASEDAVFQMATLKGLVDLPHINIIADLWIEVTIQPLSAIRVYKDEQKTIAQTAEFVLDHGDKPLALELHLYPESGHQIVTIRPKA